MFAALSPPVHAAIAALLLFAGPAPDTRLPDAARDQNTTLVRQLIQQKAPVNAANPEGQTALYWAAHWGDAEMADALLKAGADPKPASRYGLTALWEAAARGDAALTAKLLTAGAPPDAANPQGETALLAAARTGNVESVRQLLDHKANPNTKENWRGETALMLAAAEGHTEVVKLLLARGANPNERSISFDLQDRDGIVGLQASLYWKGGLTALVFAARDGQIEAGRALVEGGADPKIGDTDFGFTPLETAIFNGHLDFAEMLVQKGVNLNDGSLYLLVDQRALIPNRGDKQTAASMLRLFLDKGADPNAPFNNGKVPPRVTYPAIRFGPVHQGSTALLSAARTQELAIMKMLLDKGANPNSVTKVDHFTPLMATMTQGVGVRGGRGPGRGGTQNIVGAIKLLLDKGADVNAVNSRGMAAVHYAARTGNEEALQLLVSKGARLDVKDRIGRTPLDLAMGVMTAVTGEDGPPNQRTADVIKKLLSMN
ncbi:MAG TPA: ankyrin repeat domain-containing protein [Bryobacteraceae bacterium]|nr:ankyrin repeat domain-containing protein [Bryobacteraceae bacterium]